MTVVCLLGQAYLLAVFIRILMSWFPPTPGTTYATIFEFFYNITEPVLGPVRSMLPPVRMGVMALDLSPIVVLLGGGLLLRVIGCGGGII
ncbi:MAG TPA: YggT family protein [Acidimicrobiales bacterium]|jgi:YggT family protein